MGKREYGNQNEHAEGYCQYCQLALEQIFM